MALEDFADEPEEEAEGEEAARDLLWQQLHDHEEELGIALRHRDSLAETYRGAVDAREPTTLKW